MASIFEQLAAASADGQSFALGIISGIKGSSPQKRGAKAIFFADGRIQGTLGGGCLEAEIRDRARRALGTGQAVTFDLVLDHDFGWDDGLICGGRVAGLILPLAADAGAIWGELATLHTPRAWGIRTDYTIGWVDGNGDRAAWLYVEDVPAPCALWVAGSGHVAQAVVPMALKLDFATTVFDDRPALANSENFPAATRFRVDDWDRLLEEPTPAQPVFGLVVTRGHQHDALVLRHWIHRPFAFLGMIGSRRKARLIFTQFIEDKLATPEEIGRVVCPVGLDIKAVSVPEIAVSVLAQFVQKRAELRAAVAPLVT